MRAKSPDTLGQAGFNLVEIAVCMAALTIVTALGLPSFNAARDHYHASTLLSDLSATIAQSRHGAIGRRGYVIVCPGDRTNGCRQQSDWSQGWITFRSNTNAITPARPEDIIRENHLDIGPQLRLVTSTQRPRLRFTNSGRSDASNLTFAVCKDQRSLGQIIVNNAGRSRSVRPGDSGLCMR